MPVNNEVFNFIAATEIPIFRGLGRDAGFSAGKNKNVDMLKKQAKLTKKINIFTTSFLNQQILKLFILISI